MGYTLSLSAGAELRIGRAPERKWKLLDSDPLFAWLVAKLRWSFNRSFVFAFAFLPVLGFYVLLSYWDDFVLAMSEALSRFPSWVQLGLVSFLFVNLPHETVHGLACKLFGGRVHEIGLRFGYYFIPLFYCDASDSLLFREKSQRIWVIFAGGYCQLVVWGLATIGWWLNPPGTYRNHFSLLLAISAGFATLLTWNPLGHRDGALLLSEWLEIQHLRGRSLLALRAWLRRSSLLITPKQRLGFTLYGLLVTTYLVVITFMLVTVLWSRLTVAYKGIGALLFLAHGLVVFRRPLSRYFRRPFRSLMAFEGTVVTRWFVRLVWLIVTVGVLLIPYPYQTGGPFTVLPVVRTEVHCEIEGGRVEQVFVREGDFVSPGQPLGQIDRREYEKNLQATEAQLDNTEAKLRLLRRRLAILDPPPNIEEIQALEAEVRRLQTLVAGYRRELELTRLRAPIAGRVVTPLIEQKLGQYLKKGDLFATVEQAEAVRIEIQVPEEDAPQVRAGARVKVVAWAYPNDTVYGTVKEIAPVAATPAGSRVNSVRVIAEIPNKELRFKSQLTGYAKIKTEWIPLWLVLWRPLIRWFLVEFWFWLP